MTRGRVTLLAGCLVASGVVGLGTTEAQADRRDDARAATVTPEPLPLPDPRPAPPPPQDRGGSRFLLPEIAPRGLPPVPIPEARLSGPGPVPMPLPLLDPNGPGTPLLTPPRAALEPRQ